MNSDKEKRLTRLLRMYLSHSRSVPHSDLDERTLKQGWAAMDTTRLCQKTPSSARERAVFSSGKDGEAGDVGHIVDAAGCSQTDKQPLEARSSFLTQSYPPGSVYPGIRRHIMKSHITKYGAIAAVLLIVIVLGLPGLVSQPAWAIEETIEALKAYQGVHIVGSFTANNQPVEGDLWMRGRHQGKVSRDLVLRTASGALTWVKDGKTYSYVPEHQTIYRENAVTAGFTHWLGPRMFEVIGTIANAKVVHGRDPATGKNRVTLSASHMDVHGAQSWIFEFDADTKLPIRMTHWYNLDRSGPPAFHAREIIYYEQLDDSVFDIKPPAQAHVVDKPPTIPEQNLGILATPQAGLPVAQQSQDQAAEQIVRAFYTAAVARDTARIKQLCPLAAQWSDKMLEEIASGKTLEEQPKEVVRTGPVSYRGHTSLGPFVVVPCAIRHQDESLWHENMIVQFRGVGPEMSCVIHGPYGLSVQVE